METSEIKEDDVTVQVVNMLYSWLPPCWLKWLLFLVLIPVLISIYILFLFLVLLRNPWFMDLCTRSEAEQDLWELVFECCRCCGDGSVHWYDVSSVLWPTG